MRKRCETFTGSRGPTLSWPDGGAQMKVYVDKGAGSEDAAAIAVFLASEDAANVTGQDINSGGGVMW